jgi:hypothetical protein
MSLNIIQIHSFTSLGLQAKTKAKMAMIMRLFAAFNPPKVEKKNDAIHFGILGAAQIACVGLDA